MRYLDRKKLKISPRHRKSIGSGFLFEVLLGLILFSRIHHFSGNAYAQAAVDPNMLPPTNLTLTSLDSTIRANWTPSSDPNTMWHIFSVWDTKNTPDPSDDVLISTKVLGKTASAADGNGLQFGPKYRIRVQAMKSDGTLSNPIEATATTDRQSPLTNPSFFENFNSYTYGDLDSNYFDERLGDGALPLDVNPDSGYFDKVRVFAAEKHFHTQVIGGAEHAGVIVRPRVPLDLSNNRTATIQFEVDLAPVQLIFGKWFEINVSDHIPADQGETGLSFNRGRMVNTIQFGMFESDASLTNNGYNFPVILVSIDDNHDNVIEDNEIRTFIAKTPVFTPANVRVPFVLKVSRSYAAMYINGNKMVETTAQYLSPDSDNTNVAFMLPVHTSLDGKQQAFVSIFHKSAYSSISIENPDQKFPNLALQLIHWDMFQYDGSEGSYNPVVKTYIQPGCNHPVSVLNYGYGMYNCAILDTGQSTTLSIPDDLSKARSARLLMNGDTSVTGKYVTINGNHLDLPLDPQTDGTYSDLTQVEFPVSYLKQGTNTITIGNGSYSQIEVEVIYNIQRIMTDPPVVPMSTLNVTSQSPQVRFSPSDFLTTQDPTKTVTTYLYSFGGAGPFNYKIEQLNATDWLHITSPTTGTIDNSPALGGKVIPITMTVECPDATCPDESLGGGTGTIGILRFSITDANGNPRTDTMQVQVAVLRSRYDTDTIGSIITNFDQSSGYTTTFNKSAIPDYASTLSPTPISIGNGDSNGDGKVDTLDIQTILLHWLQSISGSIDQFADGLINSFDFTVVSRNLSSGNLPSPTP